MFNSVHFQTRLVSVLDVLSKAAVQEISKLVDEVLRVEMCRTKSEIEALRTKMLQMQRLPASTRTVAVQVCEQLKEKSVVRVTESGGGRETHTHSVQLVKDEPESLIKQEKLDEDLWDTLCELNSNKKELRCPPVDLNGPHTSDTHLEDLRLPFSTKLENGEVCATQPKRGSAESARLVTEDDAAPLWNLFAQEGEEDLVGHSRLVSGTPSHGIPAEATLGKAYVKSHSSSGRVKHGTERYRTEGGRSCHQITNMTPRTLEDRQYGCPHCGRLFGRLTCLQIHLRSHTGEKPYSCGVCGRHFTQLKSLKTHQSVHTGERPYSCKLCGKCFSRQDNCARHERFHSGNKPFSCTQCGKCFTLQGNLKTHQQTHCSFRRLLCT